jgi:hypothetical protein
MSAKGKRNILLAVGAAVVVAAVIVAIAAGGASHHPGSTEATAASQPARVRAAGEVAVAARYLGLPPAQLRSKMRSGESLAQIANATHGKSAAGLVAALVAQTSARQGSAPGASSLSPSARRERLERLRRRIERKAHRAPGYVVGVPAAARYLGVSPARLRAELRSGRSLAQIADATAGRSASGLIDARVRAREATVAQAAASGKISQTTAKAILSGLRQRVTEEVEHVPGRVEATHS